MKTDQELAQIEAHEETRRVASLHKRVMLDLGHRYTPERASVAAYELYDKTQKAAVKQLTDFLHNLRANITLGRCIVLYGSLGTGKDHLLAASLYAAAKAGYSARWINGQELYAGIRATMDRDGSKVAPNEHDFMERWTEPEVLGLSDAQPPTGDLNAWRKELLYRLVDRRYRFMRPTWVTLNAKDTQDADQKLGQQVWDRLQENGLLIPCYWQSHRERKK